MPTSLPETPTRSKGCWTCRLRRLKCDEGIRNCQRCIGCGLVCDGYGPKPIWKDGNHKEEEHLAKIKAQVLNNRRKRARFSAAVQKSRKASHAAADANHHKSTDSISRTWSSLNLTGRENELLAYYLDNIFPIQFYHQRYITPKWPSTNWFVGIVETVPPLKDAILSLSALHIHCLSQQAGSDNSGEMQNNSKTMIELHECYTSALNGLRQFISENESLSLTAGYIPILACCSQLVSFDLFRGGIGDWHTHLEAICRLTVTRSNHYPELHFEALKSENSEACCFLLGTIVWYDILSCASTGKRPILYDHIPRLLQQMPENKKGPLIRMDAIMGCENDLLLTISEISAIQEWKISSMQSRCFSTWQLVQKSQKVLDDLKLIDDRLEERLLAIDGEYTNLSTPVDQNQATTLIVSHIFACAAVVYIHVVVSGTQPSSREIMSCVEKSITAFRRLPKSSDWGRLARSVLWPACIVGCLAEKAHHRVFFREFLQAAKDDARGFGNSQTASDILEEFWGNFPTLSGSEDKEQNIRNVEAAFFSDVSNDECFMLHGWPSIIQKSGRPALLV